MSTELDPITSGYQLSKINTNFQKVEDALNNTVLRRDGLSQGEDNSMKNNLDMNSHSILNATVDVTNPRSLITVGKADARYYNVDGDTLTGPMDANNQRIQQLPEPVTPAEPARKKELDDLVRAGLAKWRNTMRAPEDEVLNELPDASDRAGKVAAFDVTTGQPIVVDPINIPADILAALASANGYTMVGGFYRQEIGNVKYGVDDSLSNWDGKRGHADILPHAGNPVTGALLGFGGEHNRAGLTITSQGVVLADAAIDGMKTAYPTASTYSIDTGRIDELGREGVLTFFPTYLRNGQENSYSMELNSDANGQPAVYIATPEYLADPNGAVTTRRLKVPNELLFSKTNKVIGRIVIPDETVKYSLDSGQHYLTYAGLPSTGATLTFAVQSRFQFDITSLINSNKLNCYLSFRCRTNANGNDITKYGLYELAGNAQFTGGSTQGDAVYIHIGNFALDPDGKEANPLNAPGTNSTTLCNYTDFQFIVTTETLTEGTNLTDRYNGFYTILQYPLAKTKAVKDVVLGYNPYVNKTVVTNVTQADNKTNTLATEVIRTVNVDYFQGMSYDDSTRNDRITTARPFEECMGEFKDWQYVFRVFDPLTQQGYNL